MILQFRKIQQEHLEKIRLWRTSEDVTKYLYTDPRISPDDQKEWHRRILRDPSRMDWIINVGGVDVGVVYLYNVEPVNRRCFWAYYLGEQFARGKGIGKAVELNILNYVFERLNLHKLCCEVFEWNKSVIEAHQKCGSRIEGIFREHIWKRSNYHNVVRMGILCHEWEQEVRDRFKYPLAQIEEWDDKKQHVLSNLTN